VRVLFKLDYGGLGMAEVFLIMRPALHASTNYVVRVLKVATTPGNGGIII
jgi:hypothetical protein